MSNGTAIASPKLHVRVAVWVLLILLTSMAWHIERGVGLLVSLITGEFIRPLPLIGCVLVLLLVFWSPDRFGLTLGKHRKAWWGYVACGAVLGAYYALSWYALPRDLVHVIGQCIRPSSYLLTPFSEELLFRGFMYGVLAEMYPESEASRRWFSKAVVMTAVLFAVWHWGWIKVLGWSWGLTCVVFSFGVGLVFGVIRRRSGSVLGPFFMHAVGNYICGL